MPMRQVKRIRLEGIFTLLSRVVNSDSTNATVPACMPKWLVGGIMAKGYIEYCVLNIAASPHPPGTYSAILEKVAGNQVNYWGDSLATISKPVTVRDGFLRGRIVCWTPINKEDPAVLTDVLEPINFNDLDISIPDNVGFNGRVFNYIFREADHLLFVETDNDLGKRLSPHRARKIFRLLFDTLSNTDPQVEVTVIPEEDTLRKILDLPKLKRLRIHLVRPNADDLDVQRLMNKLEAQRARVQDTILVAAQGEDGLEPNEETRTEAEVAEHNGFVEGSGKDANGDPIRLSTKEYPRLIRRVVDAVGSTFNEALTLAIETRVRAPRRQDP